MSRGVISMSAFGDLGRFGNQLFQYMFLKTYAATHDLDLELPPWVGNELFGAGEPPVSAVRPLVKEKSRHGIDDTIIPHSRQIYRDCDFRGYFQYHTSYYRPHRDFIRGLFQPTPQVAAIVDPGWQRIRQMGQTIVGLHVRRGDYGYECFYLTPVAWYLRWLEQVWPALDRPVLFIATDDASVVQEFASYRPVTVAEMQCHLPSAPYYGDFYALSQCDLLAIPNSTFSFGAAMLNTRLQRSVRSNLATQSFHEFDPWSDLPLHFDENEANYPGIPGTFLPRPPERFRTLRRIKRFFVHRVLRRPEQD